MEGGFEIGGGVTFTGVCSLEMVHHERSGSASVYRWLAGEEDPRVILIHDAINDFFSLGAKCQWTFCKGLVLHCATNLVPTRF